MKDEMIPVTGSIWEQMLKDHYEGRPIPFYRPYIPIQWVDWGKQDDTKR